VAEALPLRDLKLRRFDDDIMIEGYLEQSALFSVGLDMATKGHK
jgi:hypothetical protein